MALYHTHRPQTFDAVIGQEHIIQTIQNQLKHDKVAHAYLFSGPRGVGKTTTARVLAKAVNCAKRKDGAAMVCNTCDSCKEILDGRSIDVIEIDAASHTGVDSVRENIIENAQFKPTKLPYKIFIIDEVHMLSTSAFNALLKTLEEPPAHVLFVLATTELHKLPATIISRCQRFHFKKVGFEPMKKHLVAVAKEEKVSVDDDVLQRVVNKSDGCVRDAVSLLDQIMATGEKKITAAVASLVLPTSNVEQVLSFLTALVEKDAATGLSLIGQAAEDGVNMSQFGHDTLELLRTLMIHKANPNMDAPGVDISAEAKKQLVILSEKLTSGEVVALTDLILHRKAEIKTAPLPQLPLEMAVIEWCGDANQTSDKSADQQVRSSEKVEVQNPEPEVKKTAAEAVATKGKEEKKKEKSVAATTHSLEDAKKYWKHCKEQMATVSPSLSFVLNATTVEHVEGDVVTIGVSFTFHKDKLEDADCKQKLESFIAEAAGSPLSLSYIVKEEESSDTGELQELAAAFGGEVVS